MSELKPYPKYKDSGVEWIGEIPEEWNLLSLKRIATLNMGQSPPSNSVNNIKKGLPFLQGNADFKTTYPNPRVYCTEPLRVSKEDDILLSVRAPVGALNKSDQPYVIGRGLCAITSKFNSQFLWYLLQHNRIELKMKLTGSTFEAVTLEDVKNLKSLLPPLEEQKKIAKYLNKKTIQVDSLIAEKKRLIELLEEKRRAVITETVTKGLDPDVKMKDSGIDWIGEIPEHWKVTKLKYVGNITMGQSPKAHYVNDEKKGLPFLQGNAEFTERYPEAIYYCDNSPRVAKKGSLLMSVRAPVGELNNADKSYAIGRGLCAIKANDNNNTDYLYYLLSFTRTELYSKMVGSTFEAVTVRDVRELITLQPPLKEQLGIVEHLNKVNNDINSIVLDIQNQISKLKEYRESLIYEAVTGKIDLRNYEPKGDIDEAH